MSGKVTNLNALIAKEILFVKSKDYRPLFVQGALENAKYKKLDDGTWSARIPGFEGVWANRKTVEGCRKGLVEVLEGGSRNPDIFKEIGERLDEMSKQKI